jgi:hypothetical protein
MLINLQKFMHSLKRADKEVILGHEISPSSHFRKLAIKVMLNGLYIFVGVWHRISI